MNNPSEISKEWYAYAERDLITANHLVKTLYPVPLEIVCYHCQQSSEKFLKGYIADQNKTIQKTHDLKLLVNECMQTKEEFKTIEQECARLTPYGVQSRYPFAMEIEEEDMKKALNDANKIKAFVNNIYKSDENNQISEENIS